ncbi:hypothetical protein CB1_002312002 [Camelus ferus]|nr:hypothetical protein CB1_002312002 [Camelus ferus]
MGVSSYFRSYFSDIFNNDCALSSRFIQEIEHALGLGPAKQCPLREFLTVYIKNIFLNQVLAEINKEIEGVTKTSDPLKILANADTMKGLGVQRPLLQRAPALTSEVKQFVAKLISIIDYYVVAATKDSVIFFEKNVVIDYPDCYHDKSTIIVEKTVQDLLNLMHDLSAYSDQFLNMVCVKLQEYKDTCTVAYRGIVQSEEKLVISASWAKDDDISRLLKSLPNWMNMAQPKQLRPKREEEEDFIRFPVYRALSYFCVFAPAHFSSGDTLCSSHPCFLSLSSSALKIQLRAAFGKESEVLIGNLGDKLIPPQDILRDVSDLKALANMHESLEWLAGRTKSAFSNLSTSQTLLKGFHKAREDTLSIASHGESHTGSPGFSCFPEEKDAR